MRDVNDLPELLRSPLLSEAGFAHGFSTRQGGVSAPPFDSLNLARRVGDDPDHVETNYARFAAALGIAKEALYEVDQVHGNDVVDTHAGTVDALRDVKADALLATRAGVAVGVRVADCVPVLLADTTLGYVAAVHAGWRGVASAVVSKALEALVTAGAKPDRIVAAIGPHISVSHFEVGEEVVSALSSAAHGADYVDRDHPRPHVDLAAVLVAQLVSAGVRPDRVDRIPGCTFAEPARFHSFRRDGKASGRLLGAIVAREPA